MDYCDCYGTVNNGCCTYAPDPSAENLGCGCGEIGPDSCGECPIDNGGIPNSAQDCAGVCDGSGEIDDCGFCHPGGEQNPTYQHTDTDGNDHDGGWNACIGCEYDLNGSGDTYNSNHTIFPGNPSGDCNFSACIDNYTQINGLLSNNYICLTDSDLCTNGTNTGPCTTADHTCEPNLTFGTWSPNVCDWSTTGCRDAGGSNTWSSGTYGPYTSGTTVGIGGSANNYNSLVLPGDECNGASTNLNFQCKPGPDGIMQTFDTGLPTDNPDGCCCTYTPGCTEVGDINYMVTATQDDGTCGGQAVYGCTNPGFTNFNVAANVEDGSCEYDGCVDGGDWTNGSGYSLWNNYACANTGTATNLNMDVILGGNTVSAGDYLPIWNWLGCNAPGVGGNFNTQYGNFVDGSVFNSSTGVNLYDPLNILTNVAGSEQGSCTDFTGGTAGCCNDYDFDGICNPEYIQNTGSTLNPATPGDFSPLFQTDDGSCKYSGCVEPLALNYFCVDNEDLCIGGATGVINSDFGSLSPTANYNCVYPESFNCSSDYGCTDPGDGSGTYTSLLDCQTNCESTSVICNETS
jgi:hypothetical protein